MVCNANTSSGDATEIFIILENYILYLSDLPDIVKKPE